MLPATRTAREAAGFRRGACLWLEVGRDDQLVAVLRELGHLSTVRGRPAEAIRDLTQALRLSARAGQEPGGLAAFPSSVNRRAIDDGEPPLCGPGIMWSLAAD